MVLVGGRVAFTLQLAPALHQLLPRPFIGRVITLSALFTGWKEQLQHYLTPRGYGQIGYDRKLAPRAARADNASVYRGRWCSRVMSSRPPRDPSRCGYPTWL